MALDNVENPNLTPAEREFLKDKGLKFCTQGMSAFTAGGKLLATGGGYEAKGVQSMLKQAAAKFKALETETAEIAPLTDQDRAGLRRPPEGGRVLFVTWKVLGGFDKPQASATTGNGQYDAEFQKSVGVDRLWVRADEVSALAKGEFPKSLQERMTRYHLSYVMAGKVTKCDMTANDGPITGSFATDSGHSGRLLGVAEAQNGKLRRLELVAKGWATRIEDCGFAAGLTVVPKGRTVPVAVLFSLAEPDDELARILPHRVKDERYLK